jgi:hypothetical protein
MVKPIGSSPQPAPTTGPEEAKTPPAQQQTDSSSSSTQTPATSTPPEVASAMKGEHAFEGQAKAASLQANVPASSPGPAGAPPTTGPTTGPPATGGTPSGSTTSSPPTGTTTPAEPKTLKEGSKGPEVENLQTQLNEYRGAKGEKAIEVDSKYGNETSKAVTEFQKDTGLKPDGDAGARVQDRLKLETDANFKTLNPDTQQKVRDLMGKHSEQGTKPGKDLPGNQEARTNLMGIATDPNFAKLSPEGQQKALDRFTANPSDAANAQAIKDTVKDRAALENNTNFQKLNADTKKQTLDSLENFHGKAAERKNLSDIATDPNFSKLSRAHQDQTIKAFEKNPADATYTKNLRDITGGANFQGMDDATKTRVLNLASNNAANNVYTTDLSKLTNHAEYGKLSTQDKEKALNVFENTTPAGRAALQQVLDRKIDGKPAITHKGYGQTGTLLDQMNRLSTTPLDARLTTTTGTAIDKKQVTEQLLQEVANPDFYINQGNRGTCTVTATTHRLAAQNPAEYARLVTDLSTTGQSKLANGDTITVPGTDSWQQDNGSRSHGERLLQSSLMAYARPGKTYQNWNAGADGVRGNADDGFPDPTNPNNRSIDGYPDRNGSGLIPSELERVLTGIHGKKFEAYEKSYNFQDDSKDRMEKIEDQLKKGNKPTHVDISWGTNGAHALEVEKIENGRVYFRNPWGGGNIGATGTTNGTNTNNTGAGPTRQVENGNRGLESMTEADFQKYVLRVYAQ